MRDLPLSLLRSLAAVKAEGGIRPAARRLCVEHSTVSRAIRELEAIIGVPLTQSKRRGERLELTIQGSDLADAALAAMTELQYAVDQLAEPASPKQVSIATQPSVATRCLLPKLPELKLACPGMEVSIVVDQPRRAAIDPNTDLSLRMGRKPRSAKPLHILGDDIAFPVMSPEFWKQSGQPSDIDALHQMTLLHDRDTSVNWSLWRRRIGPDNLDVRAGPRLTSSDLSLRAAEQGEGVALARGWLASEALTQGKLVRPFGDLFVPLPDEWWLHEGERARGSTYVQIVRDWLCSISRTQLNP